MTPTADSRAAALDAAPRLLLELRDPDARARHAWASLGAVAFHAAFAALLWWMPSPRLPARTATEVLVDLRKSTPLIAPPAPFRLTQKEPQRGKPAAEVDISALLPRPAVQQPQRGSPRPFQPPPGAPGTRRGRELDLEVPEIPVAQALPPLAALPGA
ncbi:MAG: hypothetical protein ACUVS7_10830, partial [Bryobacteraceae bacterium]